MSAPAAIRGTFSDFKLIRTRKLAQIVIEVPIEEADAALSVLGGLPRSDDERWVAIACLAIPSPSAAPVEPKERRAFCDLSFAQQAGIRANDAAFSAFMDAEPGEDCAAAIRSGCGVKSRSEILPGTTAATLWKDLLNEFEGVR